MKEKYDSTVAGRERDFFFFIMISFFVMLEWDLRMIQDKNANAVIALDSLQTATTFEP